jgi:hypothetical protein
MPPGWFSETAPAPIITRPTSVGHLDRHGAFGMSAVERESDLDSAFGGFGTAAFMGQSCLYYCI